MSNQRYNAVTEAKGLFLSVMSNVWCSTYAVEARF